MIFRQFLDRESDTLRLRAALNRADAQLVVLYGRRRIGKSALIKNVLEFGRDLYFLSDQTSEQNQRVLFSRMVADQIDGFAKVVYPDWETLFRALANQLKGRISICLDEFPYMVKSCPSLPSVLQKLINFRILNFNLILCGSSQQMMYSYILDKKSPLYGLADEIIKLAPIPARYIAEALDCDPVQAVTEYSIWGGIPRYWELRNDYSDTDAAIGGLLLDMQGILLEEPIRLLRDDMRDTVQSATLLSIIGDGANKMSEIASRAGKPAGEITEPLKKLRDLGYVRREVPFGENEKNSKKGLYHIDDSLFRFHFRFVSPYASLLELGAVDTIMGIIKDQMPSFTGECWEQLCRKFVSGRVIDDIIYNKASRWWGKIFKDTDDNQGQMVELDVVAESLDKKHILIGECKWTDSEDAASLLNKLQDIIPHLPFVKPTQTVHICLFTKLPPQHPDLARVFLPADVLGLSRCCTQTKRQ